MAPTVRTVRILWAWKCKTKRQHVLIHYWLRVWCSYGSGAHLIANAGCTCACGASQFETSGKESTSQDNSKSWLQLGVRTQLHDRQMSGFWIACNTTWWTFGFWQLYADTPNDPTLCCLGGTSLPYISVHGMAGKASADSAWGWPGRARLSYDRRCWRSQNHSLDHIGLTCQTYWLGDWGHRRMRKHFHDQKSFMRGWHAFSYIATCVDLRIQLPHLVRGEKTRRLWNITAIRHITGFITETRSRHDLNGTANEPWAYVAKCRELFFVGSECLSAASLTMLSLTWDRLGTIPRQPRRLDPLAVPLGPGRQADGCIGCFRASWFLGTSGSASIRGLCTAVQGRTDVSGCHHDLISNSVPNPQRRTHDINDILASTVGAKLNWRTSQDRQSVLLEVQLRSQLFESGPGSQQRSRSLYN